MKLHVYPGGYTVKVQQYMPELGGNGRYAAVAEIVASTTLLTIDSVEVLGADAANFTCEI